MLEVTDPPLPFISLCYFLIGYFLPFHWKKCPYKVVLSHALHTRMLNFLLSVLRWLAPVTTVSLLLKRAARAERLGVGTEDRLRGTDCLAAFSRVGWGQCQGGCRACCAGKSSLHLRGGVEKKSYLCMHAHTQARSHTSEPNVLYSKCHGNLQHANTREHMDLIGSASTKQHVHKHTCKWAL